MSPISRATVFCIAMSYVLLGANIYQIATSDSDEEFYKEFYINLASMTDVEIPAYHPVGSDIQIMERDGQVAPNTKVAYPSLDL